MSHNSRLNKRLKSNLKSFYQDVHIIHFICWNSPSYTITVTEKWIPFKCLSVLIFLKNAAEVEVHPNGKWMYFSNRIGSGAIIAFEVQEDGNLNFLQVR